MTKERDILLSKIGTRGAKVAVIGLGYVGLPLAVGFAKAGFPTFGIDVDDRKVAALNAGRSYVLDVPKSDLAEEINRHMPAYWVGKVVDVLNAAKKAANGSRVLVVGVTYKPDIDDLRESPALDIIKLLANLGAEVSYHDPFVTSLKDEGLDVPFAELTEATLGKADCVVIVTDHAAFAWDRLRPSVRAFVDCRNALKK